MSYCNLWTTAQANPNHQLLNSVVAFELCLLPKETSFIWRCFWTSQLLVSSALKDQFRLQSKYTLADIRLNILSQIIWYLLDRWQLKVQKDTVPLQDINLSAWTYYFCAPQWKLNKMKLKQMIGKTRWTKSRDTELKIQFLNFWTEKRSPQKRWNFLQFRPQKPNPKCCLDKQYTTQTINWNGV